MTTRDQHSITRTEPAEVTERVVAPSPFVADDHWRTLAALLEREAELAEGKRRALLFADAGLLRMDLLGDDAGAARLLRASLQSSAGSTAALPGLWQIAVVQRDAALLGRVLGLARDSSGGAGIVRRGVEVLLFRMNELEAAEVVTRDAVRRTPGDRTLRELRALVLALLGRWQETLEALGGQGADTASRIEAAMVLCERLERADESGRLLRSLLGAEDGRRYALERLIDRCPPGDWSELATLYQRKLEMLGEPPGHGSRAERAATLVRLGQMLEAIDDLEGAAQRYAAAATDLSPFGQRVALHALRAVAYQRGDWRQLADIFLQLGHELEDDALRNAYLYRAAELYEARLGDPARAAMVLEEAHTPASRDRVVALRLERLDLVARRFAELEKLYIRLAEERPAEAAIYLGRAALVRELYLDDPVGACEHLRRASSIEARLVAGPDGAAGGGPPAGDRGPEPVLLWELQRIERTRSDLPRLVAAYQAEARTSADPERRAQVLCVRGALQLRLNQIYAAREAFTEALKLAPNSLLALQGLAWIYKGEQRWPEALEALRQLSRLVRDEPSRVGMVRELAHLAEVEMGEVDSAIEAFSQLVELNPNDTAGVDHLAGLLARAGRYAEVAELRERELADGASPVRALKLMHELGEIYLDRIGDMERARLAYERILAVDGGSTTALQAMARLFRRTRNLFRLRETLARELTVTKESRRRLTLSVELGRLAERTFNDDEAALAHYRTALSIDPGCVAALAGVDRIYRRQNRLPELAAFYAAAPRSQRTAQSYGSLLEQLGRWNDLADLRAWQYSQLTSPPEQAQAARGLARLCEQQLGNADQAIRWYQKTLASAPTDDESLSSLVRLLEQRGAWKDLADTLRRRLDFPADQQRRIVLLKRLGEISAEQLDQVQGAIAAYEQIVKIDRRHTSSLRALAQLYDRAGQHDDLTRILGVLAEMVEASERPGIYARMAAIAEMRQDREEALAAYRRALSLDPMHPAAFAGMARLLEQLERWRDLSDLYERTIQAVEQASAAGVPPAAGPVPLSELYAKRAELQFVRLAGAGEAAASYLRAMELDPTNEQVMQALEAVFARENDWRGLLTVYQRRGELLKDGPAELRIETYRRAARIAQERLGEPGDALVFLELVHQLDPTDESVTAALIGLYERRRDWEKLIEIYRAQVPLARTTPERVQLLGRMGRIAEEGLRDLERAVAAYREILTVDPNSVAAMQALARIYEATERWPELIQITEKEIQQTQDRQQQALLYFRIGSVVEAKFGRIDDAVRWYTAALNASPACVPAVHGLRDIYIARGDWPMVIRSLEHEARLWQEKRERASVLAQIGEVYEKRLGDVDQAISYYEGALAIDPRCVPATRALLDIYFERQDWRQAAPLTKSLNARSLRDLPPADKAELFRKRAYVAEKLGHLEEAFASLTIALEFDPFNAACIEELVACIRAGLDGRQRELEELIEHLRKTFTEKQEAAALARLAWLRGALHERRGAAGVAEALEAYRQAVEMAPEQVGPSFALADLLGRLRQWTDAAQVLDRLLARRPPKPDAVQAYLKLGEIWSEGAMDASAAIACYRKLLTLDPDNREALYRISQDYYVAGRWADARMNMERLIALEERAGAQVPPATLARHIYYLGRILQEGFRAHDQAEARYRRALELDPTFHTAAFALARSLALRGERQSATRFLAEAVHAQSERESPAAAVPLQRALAVLHRRLGDPVQAEREYKKLIGMAPPAESVADRIALAELYHAELNDDEAAVQTALGALEREPLYPPAFRLLVSIYSKAAENDRSFALLSLLEAVGDLEDIERTYLEDLRSRARLFTEPRGTLNDDLRARYMVTPLVIGAMTDMWQAVREHFERPYVKQMEQNPPPAADHFTRSATPPLRQLISSVLRIAAVDADIYVKRDATYLARCDVGPRPIVFLGPSFATALNDGERRFVLGKHLELLRLGAGLFHRMDPSEVLATLERVRELIAPEQDRTPMARELMRVFPRKNARRVTEIASAAAYGMIPSPAEWLEAIERTSDRAGLIAAGEIGPCLTALMKLQGKSPERLPLVGAARIASIDAGMPLVRYLLSEDHFSLRRAIGAWR